MNCVFEYLAPEGTRHRHRCRVCGQEVRSKSPDPSLLAANCGPPLTGPGAKFGMLCLEIGVEQKAGCDCALLRQEMDLLGVEGCRRERERLLTRLRANSSHYSLTEKAKAGWAAFRQRKPLSLEGLFDLAIERAASDKRPPAPSPPHGSQVPRFVRYADLAADTLALAARLPADLAGIIGVSRSGITPAGMLAMHLHLPLWILRQDDTPAQRSVATWAGRGDIVPAGNGWRIADRPAGDGPLLVVDDTQMSGRSITRAREVVARELAGQFRGRRVLYAAIYRNPKIPAGSVDFFAQPLPSPHFLEWNVFNSMYLPRMAVDFDGILTYDGTTRPQYLPRKGPVPLIVTGRSEAHRDGSLAWLAQWGVRANQLIMFPGKTPSDPLAIAAYKAKHFAASGLRYFIESDPVQAAEIARLARRYVLCPAAGKVF